MRNHSFFGIFKKYLLKCVIFAGDLRREGTTFRKDITMNNRILLLLLVFAGWSAMSWRWYVCKIKQKCDSEATPLIVTDAANPQAILDSAALASDQISTGNLTDTTNAAALAAEGGGTEPDVSTEPKTVKETKEEKPGLTKTENETSSGAPEDRVTIEETADEAIIHFPYNSARKVDNEQMDEYLSRLAKRLVGSNEKLLITGHTDGIGDPASNTDLAMKRAQSIKSILIKKGVSGKSITCRSFGERKPIASDDTPQGRYKNRRAIITVQ